MYFRLPLLLLAGAALVAPAAAQEWRMAPEYDVLLASYDIEPGRIELKAGEPVRLRFVNNSEQSHSFAADDFFRGARMRRQDAALVRKGSVDVAPLSTRTIVLVPRAGRYSARCGNLLHRVLGMRAVIVVT